ncbi:hypothetical protein Vretimale_14026 [Volvox reticuliferus]|uniref:Tr-type G domain-containing protein n=1 Tax=Volvox reticuliferus TaxID=1737510 RepID=A0A8J4LUB9_9CHLO|nr:hypothetical protein Vretifemale_20124 [Volvox reticuliferus]GIM10484.1 hypothetical protein Vretimale_14026 [Volvox reticuliferus]
MADTWEEDAALQSPPAPAPPPPAPTLNPNSMIFVPGQGMVPAFRPAAPVPSPVPVQPPPKVEEPIPQPPEPEEPAPRPAETDQLPDGGSAPAPAPSSVPVAPVAPPEAASAPEEPVAPLDESAVMKAYQESLVEEPRDHLNIVFIGHIDAGKSTLAGQILFLTGGVDKRTIEKYEREAKEKNREGWYMAYIMDTNEEERVKGITVEVGRAHFETDKKRYTILDAPGHKNYVPNMIQGACQADVAILVISARKGEFETGFERGGQTREHAQLAKTLGVTRLIVVVNKLDCPSVAVDGKWDKARFDQIVNGLTPFLRQCGYNLKKEVSFLPLAALYGHNIREAVSKDLCSWYDGETLFQVLDSMEPLERNPLAPFRMPIVDRWKDMGTIVMGKSEAGFVRVGDVLQVMPNKLRVKVDVVFRDEKETQSARSGENLRLRISGADEADISPGFVLSSVKNPVPVVTQFEAQLVIVELLEHNPIFTVGYKSVLHIHTACEECEVSKLVAEIDPKTKEQKKVKYIKSGGICICRITVDKPICIESFSDVPSLGRFTLRDEGRTIAIGKVVKLPKVH